MGWPQHDPTAIASVWHLPRLSACMAAPDMLSPLPRLSPEHCCRRPKRQCVLPHPDLVSSDTVQQAAEQHDSHQSKRQKSAAPHQPQAALLSAPTAPASRRPAQHSPAQAGRAADTPAQPPGHSRNPQPGQPSTHTLRHAAQQGQRQMLAQAVQPSDSWWPRASQVQHSSQTLQQSAQKGLPWPAPGVQPRTGTPASAAALPSPWALAAGADRLLQSRAQAAPAASPAQPRLPPGYPALPPRPTAAMRSHHPDVSSQAAAAAAAAARAGLQAPGWSYQPSSTGAAELARMQQGHQPLQWAYAPGPQTILPGLAVSAMRSHALPHQGRPAERLVPLYSHLGMPSSLCK